MKKVFKGIGLVLGGLIILLLIAGVVLYGRGGSASEKTYAVTPALSTVPMDSASAVHGEHLATIHACRSCHGDHLEGRVFLDIPPFRAVASNLTPGGGGVGRTYTDADWDRAIRHGVKPDGRWVLVMPSTLFHNLSDDDAADLIAYLKSLPPVDNELPATELYALGRIVAGTGGLDPDEFVATGPARTTAPPPGPTAAYGAYLTSITCIGCHGDDLRGGESPNPELPGPDLLAAGAWPLDGFMEAMRTGIRPSGAAMDDEWMPWTSFQHMTDEELQAIHEHLKTLAH